MDFFRGVFESIGLPILVYESDRFRILYANESARSFFGLSSKEIEKLSIETLFSAKILKKEGVFTQEVVLGDNETKLVEATISHIDKKAKKASIIFRDITKEMHEKESILNENERYRLAIEGANDGLWDWNIDTGEAYHSDRFATMLGYNPEELKTTYLAWAENLHPDDKDAAIKRAKEYIEGKTKVYDSEFRLKKKNGEYIWIRGRGKLVKDKNTGTTRFVGSNQDITNKVELQKQLEKQNQLLEKIFNNSVVMIYVKNSSGEYLKVNKYFRKFFGLKDSDIQKGIKTKKLVELDEYEAILNTEAKVLHSKKPGTQKSVKINNKDGVTHYFNITKVLLNPEATLEEREMLGIAVDVTEFVVMGSKLDALNKLLQKDIKKEKDGKDSALKEIKEKDILLLQQSKMALIGEMVSMIAHQWKQPISVISLVTQNISDYLELEEDRELLKSTEDEILKQITYMSETMNSFRDFFKPSKNKQPFYVCKIIKETLGIMKHSFASKGIEIELRCGDDSLVYGYPNEFKQVLMTLFSNSKDALQEKDIKNSKIEIYIKNVHKDVFVYVEDNAGGIDEELLPDKLFEPYVSTKGENGTGIGLQIAKKIVEGMDGSIKASNTQNGACFEVRLQTYTEMMTN